MASIITSPDPRRLVGITAERATHVSSTDFPGHYPGEDHSWDLDKFRAGLKIRVQRLSNRSVEFDLVGVDASVANAFRRIMIAEVPTVAIERVYIWNNTSVIADEVLASRLGLVPLNVDPSTMDIKTDSEPNTDRNTLLFSLSLTCTRNPSAPKNSTNPSELYIDHELLSRHLIWKPAGEQPLRMGHAGPTTPDIVLAKLRPGQSVEMELHAYKGVGKDHAKYSPVATATYRLHPYIKILKPIPMEHAEKFQSCFSPGVIKIDRQKGEVSVDPRGMRNDTVSREVLRHPEFQDKVELSRIRDFFIFNVESESAYKPEDIFLESINVMRAKIAVMKKAAVGLLDGNGGESIGEGDVSMADV